MVASDDSDLRHAALNILRLLGITTSNVSNIDQARAVLARQHVHMLVLDRSTQRPEFDHLEKELTKLRSDMPVVQIGPAGAVATAGGEGVPAVVPRNEIQASLGSAVMFALSRVV